MAVDWSQFTPVVQPGVVPDEPAAPAVDWSKFTPVEPRGALAEIGTGLKRSVPALQEMGGQALKYVSAPGNAAYETGQEWTEAAKKTQAQPDYTLHPEEHGAVVNALASGAEMLLPSVVPVAAAGAAAAALPLSATVGAGLGLAAGVIPAGLSQAQSTYERAIEKGVPEEEAVSAARKTGFIEAGGEALGTVLGPAGRFGKAAIGIGRKSAAKAAGELLADQAVPKVVKPFLKELPKQFAGEVGTEVGQAYTQAEIEKRAGISDVGGLEAAGQVIGPTVGLTALLAPFGLAGHALQSKAITERREAIESPETDPKARAQHARQVYDELHAIDPGAAQQFRENVAQAIAGVQPIKLDAGLLSAPQAAAPPGPQAPDWSTTTGVFPQGQALEPGPPAPLAPQWGIQPGAGIPPGGSPTPPPAGPISRALSQIQSALSTSLGAQITTTPAEQVDQAYRDQELANLLRKSEDERERSREYPLAQIQKREQEAEAAIAAGRGQGPTIPETLLGQRLKEAQEKRNAALKKPVSEDRQDEAQGQTQAVGEGEAESKVKGDAEPGTQAAPAAGVDAGQAESAGQRLRQGGVLGRAPVAGEIPQNRESERSRIDALRKRAEASRSDRTQPSGAVEAETRAQAETAGGALAEAKPETPPKGTKQSKGIYYFPTDALAREYAAQVGAPSDRIIAYGKGHAIQLKRGGNYVGPGYQSEEEVTGEPQPHAGPEVTAPAAPPAATAAELPAKPPPVPERRTDIGRRKQVAAMSETELRTALLTDDLTGLGNRRAYDEAPRAPYQASIDLDSLAWVNDHLGHETGDSYLKAFGAVFLDEANKRPGVRAYRVGGDEFRLEGEDAALRATLDATERRAAEEIVVEATLPDGTVVTKTGVGFSYGIANDFETADRINLPRHKAQRTAEGLRAERKAEPPGVVRKTPEGREGEVQAPAEGKPGDARGATGKVGGLEKAAEEVGEGQNIPEEIAYPKPGEGVKETVKRRETTEAGGLLEPAPVITRAPQLPPSRIDTGTPEVSPDRAAVHPKLFGDARTAQAIREHGFQSFNRERKYAVLSRMAREIQDPKVFKTVIETVPIDVMDDFIGKKGAAKELFHKPAMLFDALTVARKKPISPTTSRFIEAVASLGDTHAGARAELGLRSPAGGEIPTEAASAAIAGKIEGRHDVTPPASDIVLGVAGARKAPVTPPILPKTTQPAKGERAAAERAAEAQVTPEAKPKETESVKPKAAEETAPAPTETESVKSKTAGGTATPPPPEAKPDERAALEQEWLDLKAKWGSRKVGRLWKPGVPLNVRVRGEELMKLLSGRPIKLETEPAKRPIAKALPPKDELKDVGQKIEGALLPESGEGEVAPSQESGKGVSFVAEDLRDLVGGPAFLSQLNDLLKVPESPGVLGEAAQPVDRLSATRKRHLDRVRSHAQALRDILHLKTFGDKGFRALDTKTQRLVLSHMGSLVRDKEVFDSVVRLLPVDVVDHLRARQFTPKTLFHDPSMLKKALSGNLGLPIAASSYVSDSFMRASALAGAEVSSGRVLPDLIRPSENARAASGTGKDELRHRNDNTRPSGEEKPTEKGTALYSYAGERGLKTPKHALAAAREFAAQGVPMEEIRKTTGWFRGKDDRWRWELSDKDAKLKAGWDSFGNAIGDVLKHPALFENYPSLAGVDLQFSFNLPANVHGGYDPTWNAIVLNENLTQEQALSTILHELQHVVQTIEGFARGGNPTDKEFVASAAAIGIDTSDPAAMKSAYRRLLGEVEARDVQARSKLTAEELRERPPYVSQGIPEEDFIVRREGEGMSLSEAAGQSVADLRAGLIRKLGERAIAGLERAGFEIVENEEGLPEKARPPAGEAVRGVYYGGKSYLVAGNIPAGTEIGVLLHEVGTHQGLEGLLGKKLHTELLGRIKTAAMIGARNPNASPFVRAVMRAKARVPNDTRAAHVNEEILAYIVEDTANRDLPLVKRVMAAIRAWLLMRGFKLREIREEDLVALARAAVRKVSREATVQRAPAARTAGAYSAEHGPMFYSEMAKFIDAKAPGKAPAQQWKALLEGWAKAGKFKRDELEFSGLTEYLDLQDAARPKNVREFVIAKYGGPQWAKYQGATPESVIREFEALKPRQVTRDQVLGFIESDGVRIEETTLGAAPNQNKAALNARIQELSEPDDPFTAKDPADQDELTALNKRWEDFIHQPQPIATPTKHAQWQLPGAVEGSYRELLLRLPAGLPKGWRAESLPGGKVNIIGADGVTRGVWPSYESAATAMRKVEGSKIFTSSHYDEPNILSHIRFNERLDSEGKRTLFIEEIQSDFGQKTKRVKDAIKKAVDDDFNGIIDRMEKAGVLEVKCD